MRYEFGGGGGGLVFGGAYTRRGLFSEFYGKLKVIKKTKAQMHTKKEREEEKTLLLRCEGGLK